MLFKEFFMKHATVDTVHLKRTKMICTIGPATSSYEALEKLIHIGMNAARFNFSHGKYEEFEQMINDVRTIAKKHDKPVAVIQDLQGPKRRTGIMEEMTLEPNERIYLGEKPDDALRHIPIQFNFIPYLKKEHAIYLNDGYLKAEVEEVHNDYAIIRFLNSGSISSNKGINIPDLLIDKPWGTEKDLRDIDFGIKMDVDYISMSFVQKAADVERVRSIINEHKANIKVIAKIETKAGIKNIDEIIDAADVILIGRGDLAIEIGLENVPINQNIIIKKCKEKKTPVIVATQMLESMIQNPRPTRAEVNDVATATIAEADGVMLSAESAMGKYPFDATEMMRTIIKTTENRLIEDASDDFLYKIQEKSSNIEAIASAATLIANQMKSDILVVATESGKSARFVSSLRPHKTIIAITGSRKVFDQLAIMWGVRVFLIDRKVDSIDDLIDSALEILHKAHFIDKGSKVLFMTGLHVGVEGETNSLRILDIN